VSTFTDILFLARESCEYNRGPYYKTRFSGSAVITCNQADPGRLFSFSRLFRSMINPTCSWTMLSDRARGRLSHEVNVETGTKNSSVRPGTPLRGQAPGRLFACTRLRGYFPLNNSTRSVTEKKMAQFSNGRDRAHTRYAPRARISRRRRGIGGPLGPRLGPPIIAACRRSDWLAGWRQLSKQDTPNLANNRNLMNNRCPISKFGRHQHYFRYKRDLNMYLSLCFFLNKDRYIFESRLKPK